MQNNTDVTKDLNQQVALITGSSAGIGAACALALAARGARVVINHRKSAEAADAVAEACRKAGGEAQCVQADVSRAEECARLVKEAAAHWGRLDILVNNAGATKFAAHDQLDALDSEDFHNLYALNAVGPYMVIRAARSHLARQKGRIVNISSIAGVRAVGSSLAYVASKAALNGLTMGLARALAADGIRVNALCPALVTTDWFRKALGDELFEQVKAAQIAATPLKRVASPEDVAEACVFFASDASRHITGQLLLLDGGLALGAPVSLSGGDT